MDTFWLNNPTILLDKHQLTEIWPFQDLSIERKLNAITRLILILTFLGYLTTKSMKIVMTTAITLQTRMGNLDYAMALGFVLILLTVLINAIVYIVSKRRNIK